MNWKVPTSHPSKLGGSFNVTARHRTEILIRPKPCRLALDVAATREGGVSGRTHDAAIQRIPSSHLA